MTDRERLLEILNKPIFPHEMVGPLEAVADYLLDNDVVPVVRCKDCKHYEKPDESDYLGICRSGRLAVSIFGEIYPEPDYYCPYGERKDND